VPPGTIRQFPAPEEHERQPFPPPLTPNEQQPPVPRHFVPKLIRAAVHDVTLGEGEGEGGVEEQEEKEEWEGKEEELYQHITNLAHTYVRACHYVRRPRPHRVPPGQIHL